MPVITQTRLPKYAPSSPPTSTSPHLSPPHPTYIETSFDTPSKSTSYPLTGTHVRTRRVGEVPHVLEDLVKDHVDVVGNEEGAAR